MIFCQYFRRIPCPGKNIGFYVVKNQFNEFGSTLFFDYEKILPLCISHYKKLINAFPNSLYEKDIMEERYLKYMAIK